MTGRKLSTADTTDHEMSREAKCRCLRQHGRWATAHDASHVPHEISGGWRQLERHRRLALLVWLGPSRPCRPMRNDPFDTESEATMRDDAP
jgi:hypothetical protein